MLVVEFKSVSILTRHIFKIVGSCETRVFEGTGPVGRRVLNILVQALLGPH